MAQLYFRNKLQEDYDNRNIKEKAFIQIQHNNCTHRGFRIIQNYNSRLRLKCDGTRAETRSRLSAKRTSPLKSARGGGPSVQSTTGSPRRAHQR